MANRSHKAQEMQNYFDYTDVRSRSNPVSLEVQMLNLAAFELESLDLRMNRENSHFLQTVPANIDNGGVYYGGQVPSSFITADDQTTLNNVVGLLGSNQLTLTLYDDTLPIPTRVAVDTSRGPVAFTNPIIMDVTGEGDTISGTYAVQYANPGTLPIPNKLTFWVDQIELNTLGITISITGQVTPQPAWVNEQKTTTELISITEQGAFTSFNRWSVVTEIAVRQLSTGVRLRAWSMPFNLPAVPDTARPYTNPAERGVLFDRYWQIDNINGWLNESYEPGGFSNLEVIDSYGLSGTMVDVAVEPWTNGLFLASTNTLYYADRREYQPNLQDTGLVAEPLYGLQVFRDVLKYGPTTYVVLQGTPYANSINIFQYRYTVNGTNSILPDGALGPINAGWRRGAPQPVAFPLVTLGDYQFELECQDNNGVLTSDIYPFRNFQFTPLATIGTTTLIDSIRGIAFDSYGQLWVWNGLFALPLTLAHDGYVLDASTSTIYVTEPFSSLQIS